MPSQPLALPKLPIASPGTHRALVRASTRALLALAVALAAPASTAWAGGTHAFHVTDYKELNEGEAHGVLLSSLGEASSGFGTERVEVSESVVFSMATAPDGTVYLGTGDQGALYAYRKGKLRKVTKLDGVLVTALAIGPGGRVFAGTMPGGKIFVVEPSGTARELAKLAAEHVWALAYDEARRALYAGTGAGGKLFQIEISAGGKSLSAGRVRVLYDSGEKHLLSLALAKDGSLYVGSSDRALLYRVIPGSKGAAPRVQAVHDFEGDEVRALALHGGTLFVATNDLEKSTTSTVTAGTNSSISTTALSTSRDRKAKGAVYRVDPEGPVERLHALSSGYFTALHVDEEGGLYAASGSNGRVYLIRPDRTVLTAFDLPERQVLALGLSGPERLLGTGDAGALYRLASGPPKDAAYVSKVFDGKFPCRWGKLHWSGHGRLKLETRSGNTAHPDKTWSAWQGLARAGTVPRGGSGQVTSSETRYLQVRVGFAGRATLRDFTVYYHPQNQRPRVTEIGVAEQPAGKASSKTVQGTPPRSPVVKLRWKVENPDGDTLVYRLFFRQEDEAGWKPIVSPAPVTRPEFDWNTESVPDGDYVVKVVASDERVNPREEALEHALISPPFLVDNRKPDLLDLRVSYPVASGKARDTFSTVTDLAYSVDGGEWQPFASVDGVFDDPVESFKVQLPPDLAPGPHSLAVRAVDAAANTGAAQTSFQVK